VPEAAELPDESNGDVELNGTLEQALQSLPVALREAFLLKHDAEYTYEEVAELTNASVSAVKMRVHRAREALRTYLMRQGVQAA
jgi:RNA polymerase sigma-70 factor (ECF subfamily)